MALTDVRCGCFLGLVVLALRLFFGGSVSWAQASVLFAALSSRQQFLPNLNAVLSGGFGGISGILHGSSL